MLHTLTLKGHKHDRLNQVSTNLTRLYSFLSRYEPREGYAVEVQDRNGKELDWSVDRGVLDVLSPKPEPCAFPLKVLIVPMREAWEKGDAQLYRQKCGTKRLQWPWHHTSPPNWLSHIDVAASRVATPSASSMATSSVAACSAASTKNNLSMVEKFAIADLNNMTAKQLKALCDQHGILPLGAVERSDLVQALVSHGRQ